MLTEEIIWDDRIEALPDGSLHVREATHILRSGKRDAAFPPRYRRYVLQPGDDLDGRPKRVIAVANAIWHPDVLEAGRRAETVPDVAAGLRCTWQKASSAR